MSQHLKAEITGNSSPATGVYVIEFLAPNLAQAARPGQFLHISCGEAHDPLLRRPISIHAVNRHAGLVRIMFRVVGRGTALLAEKQDGYLDIMGPLGNGFGGPALQPDKNQCNPVEIQSATGSIILVGGGIGAAPLYFLMQKLAVTEAAPRVKVLLGAGGAGQLLTMEAAVSLGLAVRLSTDDGSAGLHGPVTYLLADEMRHKTDYVYACGPAPMLKMVCQLLKQAGVPGEVSLEERMACGVGACLSCACRVWEPGGEENYKQACVDGPVFSATEVVW